jgi:hypothetical protein
VFVNERGHPLTTDNAAFRRSWQRARTSLQPIVWDNDGSVLPRRMQADQLFAHALATGTARSPEPEGLGGSGVPGSPSGHGAGGSGPCPPVPPGGGPAPPPRVPGPPGRPGRPGCWRQRAELRKAARGSPHAPVPGAGPSGWRPPRPSPVLVAERRAGSSPVPCWPRCRVSPWCRTGSSERQCSRPSSAPSPVPPTKAPGKKGQQVELVSG